MRRKTDFAVGGTRAIFSRDDLLKLAAALPRFRPFAGEDNPEYLHSTTSPHKGECYFNVWRADHKYLLKAERSALYFFFEGVMAAHGITPLS